MIYEKIPMKELGSTAEAVLTTYILEDTPEFAVKKRPVVVALKAIIESWIEDTNGGRPKNIENAINEVLRLAFGVKKYTPVNQTIKPSNDNNFEGSMNRIAEEIAQKIKSFASEKNKKR